MSFSCALNAATGDTLSSEPRMLVAIVGSVAGHGAPHSLLFGWYWTETALFLVGSGWCRWCSEG